jgi:hypothetical protein
MCQFSANFAKKNDCPSELGAVGEYKPTFLILPSQSNKPLQVSH